MGPDVLWARGCGGRELFPLQWLHALSLAEKKKEFGLMSGSPRRGLQLVWAYVTYFRNGTSESLFRVNTGIPSSSLLSNVTEGPVPLAHCLRVLVKKLRWPDWEEKNTDA